MSGKRRRDDGWDDNQPDTRDGRRDPWADSSVDDWGIAAGDSGRGAYPDGTSGGRGAAPGFAPGGSRERGDRYGAGPASSGRSGAAGAAAGGYGRPAAGYGDSRQDPGYPPGRPDPAGYDGGSGNGWDGGSYGVSRPGAGGPVPEFTPADGDDPDDDAAAGAPRPIGRLSIYTLHEDKTREFDRLAELAAEGVRTAEPDTLVYVIHIVPKAPMQRIMYEIYRDRAAFLAHERQRHIRQFATDRASCVLATNVIDLRLKYAKVAALSATSAPPEWPPGPPRADRPVAPGAAYPGAAQSQPPASRGSQQAPEPQYQPARYQGALGDPTVTTYGQGRDQYPAGGRQYPAGGRQHAATGREHYPSTAAQYESTASDDNGYGGANGQSARAAGYFEPARPANGGRYSSNSGYSGANGYRGGNGRAGEGGYWPANGRPHGDGYRQDGSYASGSGYSSGTYQNGGNYPDSDAYPRAEGAANGSGYPGGSGYGPSGAYPDDAGADAGYGAQYTPRFRELTTGGDDAAPAGRTDRAGRGDAGDRDGFGDEPRPPSRPSDRDPRPPGRR